MTTNQEAEAMAQMLQDANDYPHHPLNDEARWEIQEEMYEADELGADT